MKYIRTEDGIYRADQPIEPEKELQIKWIDSHCFETSWKTKPHDWKQADNLEELCDEFVCEENHYIMKPYWLKYNDEGYSNETYHQGIMNAFRNKLFNYKDYHWFGAIWTDKGLIYVAKMNEKGELELL